MRKLVYGLLLVNVIVAAVVFLPKLRKADSEAALPSTRNKTRRATINPLLTDYKTAVNIEKAAVEGPLSQADFETLKNVIERNQVNGGLHQHLARDGGVTVLMIAAAHNHLSQNQKRQALQIVQRDLAFVKSLSQTSAALNTIPIKARRSGFTKEELYCLSILYVTKMGGEAVPIALPYADALDPKLREMARKVLADAGYKIKP